MPSFDIVSQVNPMEIENAVNQARKELATRFDFKGSKAEIALEKNEIKLSAEDQFKIKALVEIVIAKLAKRGIKQITGFIREGKFKVTTQIQGDEVRVTGKNRDDLQAVIAAVRAKDFPVALSFQNFRD